MNTLPNSIPPIEPPQGFPFYSTNALRIARLQRAKYLCEECHCLSPYLQVHHLTYSRFNKELPEDILLLCPQCHSTKHAYRPDIEGVDPHGVRALRRFLGLSQQSMARKLRVTCNMISAWERGIKPQIKHRKALYDLASSLHVPARISRLLPDFPNRSNIRGNA